MEATLLGGPVPPEVQANVFDQDDPAEPARPSLAYNRYPLSSPRVNGSSRLDRGLPEN